MGRGIRRGRLLGGIGMIIRSQGVQVLGGQYVNMVLQSIEILR